MNLILKKKYFLYLFLITYVVFGIFLSLTNGISHDEYHEQLNWQVNFSAIINFFKFGNYDELLNYDDKYHGIGFHFISQPIQLILHKLIAELNGLSLYGGYLITKHAVVFLLFTISGIFFYLLCLKISQNINFSIISSIIYLLYPYLFGHSLFNSKDIPFLSFWLINTYIFLSIIENLFYDIKIKMSKIILFSFFTAFLLSIRILGSIIFFEYFIAIIILFNIKQINLINFIKKKYLVFLIFFISLFIFIYIMNPILWHNPLELFNSIKYMSKYFNDICTLTLGECMRSLSLPASYYFIWLFFKLPILILMGICLFPLVEGKIFKDKIKCIYYGTLIITVFSILFVFVLKKIAIYDEIRHVMFLVPMILIVGLANIFFFSKKLFYSLSVLTIFFFIFENININPYQYTWLNSFAKFTNITKNFEVDYWGVSNKNLTKKIIEYTEKNSVNKNTCVYGDMYAKEFLINKNFNCFKTYSQLDAAKIRPLFAYKNLKNVKRSAPKDCKLIWNETYRYSFYQKDISVGTLWYCN